MTQDFDDPELEQQWSDQRQYLEAGAASYPLSAERRAEVLSRAHRARRNRVASVAGSILLVLGLSVGALVLAGSRPTEHARIDTADSWSYEWVPNPSGEPGVCARVTSGSASYVGCFRGARSIDMPAYWRVDGHDLVVYPVSPPEDGGTIRLVVKTVDDWLRSDHGASDLCSGLGRPINSVGDREPIHSIGNVLEDEYGANTPSLSYVGCVWSGATRYLWGNLNTPANHASGDELVTFFEQHDGQWSVLGAVDFSLDRETRCSVLPDDHDPPLMSARQACATLGGP